MMADAAAATRAARAPPPGASRIAYVDHCQRAAPRAPRRLQVVGRRRDKEAEMSPGGTWRVR